MKNLTTVLITALLIQSCASAQSVFELSPDQSMSITGKGPGQDAAYNPYGDGNSIAVIKNISTNPFEIRVQNKGVIIKKITLAAGENQEVQLLKGHELYLDSRERARAEVTFRKE